MAKKKTARKTDRGYRRPKPPRGTDLSHIAEELRGLALPIADLVPDPDNARLHNDGNLTAIVASLRKFGQRKPIVVNRRTMAIEAGNGTLQAAQHLEWTHLAAVLVEDDAATALGYSIADNRSGDLAAWDLDILAGQIDLIEDEDEDLAADLLLDELRQADDDEAGSGGESLEVPSAYQVVVECKNEADQKAVFSEFQGRGYTVRLLTM